MNAPREALAGGRARSVTSVLTAGNWVTAICRTSHGTPL